MFTTLLESSARRSSQYRYTIASVLAHGTLIAGAAVATARAADVGRHEPPREETLVYVPVPAPAPRTLPAAPASPQPGELPRSAWQEVAQTAISIDLSRIPERLPPIGAAIGDIMTRARDDLGRARGDGARAGGAPAADGGYYTYAQVERSASLRTAVEPPYPATLRAAGVSGKVVLHLVVDSTGRVDLAQVRVRESSAEQFTTAVRAILPRLRFAPAMLDGRPVAQLVELPFQFSLRR